VTKQRRPWTPDEQAIGIVETFAELGDDHGINRTDLANRVGITPDMLDYRLRWLVAYGFLERIGEDRRRLRYKVLKVPQRDEHDTGVPRARGRRLDPDEAARMRTKIIRMYEEGRTIRQIADTVGRSSASVYRVLEADPTVTLRPRGGYSRP
jgi:Helix-turn-helix domain